MAAAAALVTPLECPTCKGPVDVKSRHVSVAGSAVRIYCSGDCLRNAGKPREPIAPEVEIEPRRPRWWMFGLAGGFVVGATYLVTFYAGHSEEPEQALEPPVIAVPAVTPAVASTPPPPVEDPRTVEDRALVRELMEDAWIHPLAGPTRRMPVNHNGAFGAIRDGVRQPECLSGHCGVDLGNVWGEPIHAVHDGVIDWVNRGPNDEHGGVFVKIAHRDGTLFTWYFHLAAVPRWVHRGAKVNAGQVIGLLGDTGIKHSAPHLHFAMSVKPSKSAYERYLDPEPLIAIWPLWIPTDHNNGRLTVVAEPGMPVRAPARRKARPAPRTQAASAPTTTTATAPDPTPAAPAAPAANDNLIQSP